MVGLFWSNIGMAQRFASLMFALIASVHVFALFSPASLWVEYYYNEPTRPIFSVHDNLEFRTIKTQKRGGEFSWSETLYCEVGGVTKYIDRYPTSATIPKPEGEPVQSVGGYSYFGAMPKSWAFCHVVSVTHVHLPFFAKVTSQPHKTRKFVVNWPGPSGSGNENIK